MFLAGNKVTGITTSVVRVRDRVWSETGPFGSSCYHVDDNPVLR